jgi:hypothetical protein
LLVVIDVPPEVFLDGFDDDSGRVGGVHRRVMLEAVAAPSIVPRIGAVPISMPGRNAFAQLPQWKKTHLSGSSP